jgi:alkanesulfonate monooxygenase SsuD/methylene tetrahydromethanopterin reductase-like flavin-dependent oxidoreductase (luciferase family)
MGGIDMSTQRRGVALTPMEARHDIIVRTAELADELGYEAFAVAEGWGFDSTVLLTEVALRTRRIKVVSGILSVWGRTPGTLAMTAATLHQLSGGRYVLGLGPSTKALVEGFHDLPFVHPAGKLREVTTKVRAILAGERVPVETLGRGRCAWARRPCPTCQSGSRRWGSTPPGSSPSWPTVGSRFSSCSTRSPTEPPRSGSSGRRPARKVRH